MMNSAARQRSGRAGPSRTLLLFLAALLLIAGTSAHLSPLAAAEPALEPRRAPPAGEIRFLVLGDWGRQGGSRQREVAQGMGDRAAARGADFVITTGDNFYEDGVGSVDDEAWRISFREIYTSPSLDIPWYPVIGNHDYHGSIQAQIDYSRRDGRWRMPARYHSFERPVGRERALFVFLDTISLSRNLPVDEMEIFRPPVPGPGGPDAVARRNPRRIDGGVEDRRGAPPSLLRGRHARPHEGTAEPPSADLLKDMEFMSIFLVTTTTSSTSSPRA